MSEPTQGFTPRYRQSPLPGYDKPADSSREPPHLERPDETNPLSPAPEFPRSLHVGTIRALGRDAGREPQRGRCGGRRQAPRSGERGPRGVRVHARRQGRHLPEVGVGQPEPGALAGGARRGTPARRRAAAGGGGHRGQRSRRPRRCAASGSGSARPGSPRSSAPRRPMSIVIPLGGDLYLLRRRGRTARTDHRDAQPRDRPQAHSRRHPRSPSSATTSCTSSTWTPRRTSSSATGPATASPTASPNSSPRRRWIGSSGFWWSPDGATDRLSGDRRAAHPALLDRPPGGRDDLGRDAPLSLRRRGQRQGPARRRRRRRRPDPLADARRSRRGLLPRPRQLGDAPDVPGPGPDSRPEGLRLFRIDVESARNDPPDRGEGPRPGSTSTTTCAWSRRPARSSGPPSGSGFRHLELHDRDGKLVRDADLGRMARRWRRRTRSRSGARSGSSRAARPRSRAQLYRVSLDGGDAVRVSRTSRARIGRSSRRMASTSSTSSRARTGPRSPRSATARARCSPRSTTPATDPRLASLASSPPRTWSSSRTATASTLLGAYYPPRSKALGEKAPLVVMVYGGPHVQTVTESWAMTADLTAQYLAERGFAVWKMDNRGSSPRGHAFEAALNRDMGSVEVRDQVDGVAFVGEAGPRSIASRVGVTGRSYGGYMTLRCLTEAPDVFQAGVAVAPGDRLGRLRHRLHRAVHGDARQQPGRVPRLVGPAPRRASFAASCSLIHGMLDENVHFRHTARLATALIAAANRSPCSPCPTNGTRRAATPIGSTWPSGCSSSSRGLAHGEVPVRRGGIGRSCETDVRSSHRRVNRSGPSTHSPAPGNDPTRCLPRRPPVRDSEPPCPRHRPRARHARREAIIIGVVWLASTVYCCAYCYWSGYIRAGGPRAGGRPADLGDAVVGLLGGHGPLAGLLALHLLVRRASTWPTTTWAGSRRRARERHPRRGRP